MDRNKPMRKLKHMHRLSIIILKNNFFKIHLTVSVLIFGGVVCYFICKKVALKHFDKQQ